MAPAGKSKLVAQVATSPSFPPTLTTATITKEEDLGPVLPLTAGDTSEWGETLICPGSAERSTPAKTAYPFFFHSVFTGLVPSFSKFFYATLGQYKIHALHLQPNSILLLSIFAF